MKFMNELQFGTENAQIKMETLRKTKSTTVQFGIVRTQRKIWKPYFR